MCDNHIGHIEYIYRGIYILKLRQDTLTIGVVYSWPVRPLSGSGFFRQSFGSGKLPVNVTKE